MDSTIKTVVMEYLIFIGIVYLFVFSFLKIKNVGKNHINIQNSILFIITSGVMCVAYYLFLCGALISAPVLILLFGGIVYFLWGICPLLGSHTIAFFVMPILGKSTNHFKPLILIVLFSILITFVFDKSDSPLNVKAFAVCGIPLLVTNMFYFWEDSFKIVITSIVCAVMIKITVIESCKVIEDFNKYQLSYDQYIIDPLTGLYNRRKIDMLQQTGEAISIVIIDIDDFKEVNDRYGHVAGDICLKGVADVIMGCCNEDEIPLRFGGDEFLILCKSKSKEYTSNLAERIRDKISRYSFIYNQCNITVTVSIGIKNFDKDVDVQKLINEADVAMYCSKSTGKNTITAT